MESQRTVSELITPAFLIDIERVRRNCTRMIENCKEIGVTLRAQTKTHKTIEGALLQTGGTKRGLVTSTLKECEFYADHGFDDILCGYPFTPHHLPRVAKLTSRLDNFHVMVDSEVAVNTLVSNSPPPGKVWSVFLSIDAGHGREGVWWGDGSRGEELASQLYNSPFVSFAGAYVHCGNSYTAKQPKDVAEIREQAIEHLLSFVDRIKARGIKCPVFGIGSTPTCSQTTPSMSKLTELHPGNYIFYDVQQMSLWACEESDIACCVATRVIGHYPEKKQMLIDCGFTGLTKQGIGRLPSGCCIFKGQPNLKMDSMTQEIGQVTAVKGEISFEDYPIGSLLYIYPWHSCATAGLYPVYYVVEGDVIVDHWKPTRGW